MVLGTCSMANQSFVVTTSYFQKVMELGLVWLRSCLLPPLWVTADNFLLTAGGEIPHPDELSTCGTVPNPQTFPHGPLAASAAALTLLPLFASLGYGNDEGHSYEKENEGLARPWVSNEPMAELTSHLSAFRPPWGSAPDTRLCFGTRTTSFSFMMGVVRAGFLMTSSLVKHLSCVYLIREWVWRIVSVLQYQQQ